MKQPTKLTAAQRLARITDLNKKLQEDNDMLRTQYGVDAQMGVDEEGLQQAAEWKAQDATNEALATMPDFSRKVGMALQPALDEETPTQKLGAGYGQRMKSELEPRLRRALDPIFPRRRV